MSEHPETEGMDVSDNVLAHLQEARAALLDERDAGKNSRELSVTLTEIDTAILWRKEDLSLKTPTVNEADR